jgi:hypothetical protein
MGGHQADIPSGRYSRTRREACLVWMIDASSKAVAGCRDPAHHGEICRIVAVHAPPATTVSSGGEGPEYGGGSWPHLLPLTMLPSK